eukprot:128313-Prorocentrum_minimum.AAC.2
MSNVYNLEPPTKGKVVLSTSHGDIDVELWSKEAPKVCSCVLASYAYPLHLGPSLESFSQRSPNFRLGPSYFDIGLS